MLFGKLGARRSTISAGGWARCDVFQIKGARFEKRCNVYASTFILAVSVLFAGGVRASGAPGNDIHLTQGNFGMKSVSLSCTDVPAQMCETFQTMIHKRYPDIIVLSAEEDADLAVELVVLKKSDHTMSGRLKWRDVNGAVDGPVIGFHVADAVISERNYKDFLIGLLTGSKIPI